MTDNFFHHRVTESQRNSNQFLFPFFPLCLCVSVVDLLATDHWLTGY